MKLSYEGVTSPFDQVYYPDISLALSEELKVELHQKIQSVLGLPIEKSVDFIRLSKKGVFAPHQAHTDAIMGDYTALVYLNPVERGGTSILEHKLGMRLNPTTETEERLWKRDANNAFMWKQVGFCPARFNRLFLIDSYLFHRSEPIGGFGDTVEDGRLVLISFFNLKKDV